MKIGLLSILIPMVAFIAIPQPLQGQQNFELQRLWKTLDAGTANALLEESPGRPGEREVFRLNEDLMKALLEQAPDEALTLGEPSGTIITLPMPDGSFQRFAVKDSPVVEPELQLKYPEMRTYLGQGVDDPSATTRFSMSPEGFQAIILRGGRTVLLEPVHFADSGIHLSVYKDSLQFPLQPELLIEGRSDERQFTDDLISVPIIFSRGNKLRQLRLAIALNGEETSRFDCIPVGCGQFSVMTYLINTVNTANAVLEIDVGVRLVLVGNNELVIFPDPDTDPYTTQEQLMEENQLTLDTVIGSQNYDVGQVWGDFYDVRMVSSESRACSEGVKAKAVAHANPGGYGYDPHLNFFVHLIGHQLGAHHTQNSTRPTGRYAATAFEPGSGSTIMGSAGFAPFRAGINLQFGAADYFHIASLREITSFLDSSGCGIETPTQNNPPSVAPDISEITIPKESFFRLFSSGSDPENVSGLTYIWEQYDLGSPADSLDPNLQGPSFRSGPFPSGYSWKNFPLNWFGNYDPATNIPEPTWRCRRFNQDPADFPRGVCMQGEVLPATSRIMNFQITVRDNHAGGGGIATNFARVIVDENSGPFRVLTAQDSILDWQGGSVQTITWDVANTDSAPVNATHVRILLFAEDTHVLADSTPNDGSHQVRIPNSPTGSRRAFIRIEHPQGYFYDDSRESIEITEVASANDRFDFDGDNIADISTFTPSNGQWLFKRSSNGSTGGIAFGSANERLVPADYTGDGKTDIAFFKPAGVWYIYRSEEPSFYFVDFGTDGDIPAPGDFDGDGTDDIAIYRPSTGTWWIRRSSDESVFAVPWGVPEDLPVVADYDGDGTDDVAVFRPSVQEWWILGSTSGVTAYKFGFPNVQAVPGDFTGDGRADIAFWYPIEKRWYILRSDDNSFYAFNWGDSTDIPLQGDFDGDLVSDAAVWRPSNQTWYILGSTDGFTSLTFGTKGDYPVPFSYVVPQSLNQSPPGGNLVVTKTADTNDGVCDSDCSLREAIAAANADPANDVVEFDPGVFGSPQTITLGESTLSVTNSGTLTITGPGSGLLNISGGGTKTVFDIAPSADVVMSDLTVTGGNPTGIRIDNLSDLTLNDTVVSGNSNPSGNGGGIVSFKGTLTVNNSTISNNFAVTGGGIWNSSGTLNINDSVISGNNGSGSAGGILSQGTDANATIHRSTIDNNITAGQFNAGGGIVSGGDLSIFDSTISNNDAGQGGGIYQAGNPLTVLNLTNTTISGNDADNWGGGLSVTNGTVNAVNTTISNNTSGASGGGVVSTAVFNSMNTIYADNTNTTGGEHDFEGTLTSLGYNLIEDTTGTIIAGDTTGNITGVDPMLGPLQYNLGPTETHALLVGSPAIETGNSPAINTDQRGKARPYDDPAIPNSADGSDIGAFERQASDPFGAFSFNGAGVPELGQEVDWFFHKSFRALLFMEREIGVAIPVSGRLALSRPLSDSALP